MSKVSILLTSTLCFAVIRTPIVRPWLRLDSGISHLKISDNGRFIAFSKKNGQSLSIVNTVSKEAFKISTHSVDPSFFFSPDGNRLFYKQKIIRDKKLIEQLNVFDIALAKKIIIKEFSGLSGHLSFDPKSLRIYYSNKGIIQTYKINYPDQRLAHWQVANRTDFGHWVVSQKAIMWVHGHEIISVLKSNVQNFSISPDGDRIVWQNSNFDILVSSKGAKPVHLSKGLDPSWHPKDKSILFAKAQMIGDKIFQTDLAVFSNDSTLRIITKTPGSNERWPKWSGDGKRVVFTKDKSTDIFTLEL